MDLYLTTNVLGTFAVTLNVGNHHVAVVLVVGSILVLVLLPMGVGLGLCIAVFEVLSSLKPTGGT